MRIGQIRDKVEPSKMRLPACPLPRPGDDVVWFQGSVRHSGELVGHMVNDSPYVQVEHRVPPRLTSFDSVRLREPGGGIEPMWHRLPSGGTLTKPLDGERR